MSGFSLASALWTQSTWVFDHVENLKPASAGEQRNLLGMPVEQEPWVEPPEPIDTPFVRVPGLLTAECATGAHDSSYLAVEVQADPSDPRADDVGGELIYNGTVLHNWGLHLVDVNLAQGNLIDIVRQQSQAYRASGS
jgi:hypothetical protein